MLAEKIINGEVVNGSYFEIARHDGTIVETIPLKSVVRFVCHYLIVYFGAATPISTDIANKKPRQSFCDGVRWASVGLTAVRSICLARICIALEVRDHKVPTDGDSVVARSRSPRVAHMGSVSRLCCTVKVNRKGVTGSRSTGHGRC